MARTGMREVAIVGNPGPEHVGNHLRNAARELGLAHHLYDSGAAYQADAVTAKFNWWLRSHRPARLGEFSREVILRCIDRSTGCILTTGLAPVEAEALVQAGKAGIVRINFLTDDPWNPKHTAKWFMRSLPEYDIVFTPRRANIEDLRRIGCRRVEYLPFGYAPEIHFLETAREDQERQEYAADVFFAGGADEERVPVVAAFIRAGMGIALYGGYWERYRETRVCARGFATPEMIRKSAGSARISLCLVRRANRDGHAMRTYELAAMGACILAEDTEEHREILGPDGVGAVYFRSAKEMVEKARELLRDNSRRERLAKEAQRRICGGSNTYRDRLTEMLRLAAAGAR